MSSRALELGTFLLTSSQDKLEISVRTSAIFRLPGCIANFSSSSILEALKGGKIWATRGIGMILNVQISMDHTLLDLSRDRELLEKIGSQTQRAPLWAQLHLSSAIGYHNQTGQSEYAPQFSIHINHELPNPRDPIIPGPDINSDIQPPKGVPNLEIEALNIAFDFSTIKKKPLELQPPWEFIGEYHTPREPEFCGINEIEKYGEELHQVVGHMGRTLSQTVRDNFLDLATTSIPKSPPHLGSSCQSGEGSIQTSLPWSVLKPSKRSLEAQNDQNVPPPTDLAQYNPPFSQTESSESKVPQAKPAKLSRTRRHKDERCAILRTWLELHPRNSYPNRAEKAELMKQTGYAESSLVITLRHVRRMIKSSLTAQHTVNVSSTLPEEGIHWTKQGSPKEQRLSFPEELLFEDGSSIFDEYTLSPFLSPPSSAESMVCSDNSFSTSLSPGIPTYLEPFSLQSSPTIDWPSACKMSEVALRTLIGGLQQRPRGIKPRFPRLDSHLSLVAPAIFNPGFKQSMIHNTLFLSTISSVFISWSRNAQGPGLRERLSSLSKCLLLISDREAVGEDCSPRRLMTVVENRLWSMMHNKVYDPHASRNMPYETEDTTEKPDDSKEDDDILVGIQGEISTSSSDGIREEELFYEEDIFEDLLLSDDEDGLLNYLREQDEERERREIERETDEMLFGSSSISDGDESDILMGGDRSSVNSGEDSMLF